MVDAPLSTRPRQTNMRISTKVFLGGIVVVAAALAIIPEKSISVGGEPSVIQGEDSIFAHVNSIGIVDNVIIISQENINSGNWGPPSEWKRTSQSGTIRKNYAAKGYVYDVTRDAFIPPKPIGAKIFDETSARWVVPAPQKSTFVISTST